MDIGSRLVCNIVPKMFAVGDPCLFSIWEINSRSYSYDETAQAGLVQALETIEALRASRVLVLGDLAVKS